MPRKRTTRLKPASKPAKGKVAVADGVSENERKEQLAVFLRDYDYQVQKVLKDIDKKKRTMIIFIQMQFEKQISELPSEIKDMTLKEFAKSGGTFEQAKAHPQDSSQDSSQKRLAEIQNLKWSAPERDGLEMISEEGSDESAPAIKVPASAKLKAKKSKSVMPPPSTRKSKRTKAQCATPLNAGTGGGWGQTPLITPKFNPHLPTTPENVREVRPGERLMSLAGSPVQLAKRRKAIGGDVNKNELAHNWSDIAGVDLTPNRVERMLRLVSTSVALK